VDLATPLDPFPEDMPLRQRVAVRTALKDDLERQLGVEVSVVRESVVEWSQGGS
jgi:hypothetical protein